MYYKLVQQFRSSSDVVLLRYYEFQRKDDGPNYYLPLKDAPSYDKCPLMSSEITKYKNSGNLIFKKQV